MKTYSKEVQEVAARIHAMTCHSNHVDVCGWYYGNFKTPFYERLRCLEKAEKLFIELNFDALKIVRIMHKTLSPYTYEHFSLKNEGIEDKDE